MDVDPGIAFVAEHDIEGVLVESTSRPCPVALLIKDMANLPDRIALGVKLKSLPDNLCFCLVDYKLFPFHLITKRNRTAADVRFQGGLVHSPRDFL